MKYFATGKIVFEVDLNDIEADSLEDAEKKAKEICKDYYRLNVVNAHHDADNVEFDITAGEYGDQ